MSQKIIEPYEHQCGAGGCVWMGWHGEEDKLTNIYLHVNKDGTPSTLIIRYSSEPSDYISYPFLKDAQPTTVCTTIDKNKVVHGHKLGNKVTYCGEHIIKEMTSTSFHPEDIECLRCQQVSSYINK